MSAAKIRVGCFKCGTGEEQYVDLNSVIHKCPLCENENNLAELLIDQNYGKKQEITHLKKLLKEAMPWVRYFKEDQESNHRFMANCGLMERWIGEVGELK